VTSPKKNRPSQGPLYHILIILNDKGGMRKSTFMIFLISILLRAKMKVAGFEVDDQSRVGGLFGGIVKTASLPDTETLSKTGLGDTAILSPMMDALIGPTEDGTIVIEIGANLSERVALALKTNLVSGLIPADKKIAILTLIDGSDDAIVLGARSARLLQAALPHADIIAVQPRSVLGVDPTSNRMSELAKSAYLEVIEPAARSNGSLVWPMMSQDILHAFEALKVDPVSMLHTDVGRIGQAGYDRDRMDFEPDEQSYKWMGRRIQTELQIYLANLIRETQRMLGFPDELE